MLNRILTDIDREKYKPLIDKMFKLCPDMMKRKYPRANVQQAFVIDTVQNMATENIKILCVGGYEDTALESLKKLEYKITSIDPNINVDLHTFRLIAKDKFGIIFSTSVIEHVNDDEGFIDDICFLLAEKGYAVLTCDFKNNYKFGDKVPTTDVRLYTEYDLSVRLNKVIEKNNCEIVDNPNWNGDSKFALEGINYSFATFVWRKK